MRTLCLMIFLTLWTWVECQQHSHNGKSSHSYNFQLSNQRERTRRLQGPVDHKRISYPQYSVSRSSPSSRKQQNKKNGVPPYAVQMEPLVQYSQPDPLYTIEKQYLSEAKLPETSSNDLIKKSVPSLMVADITEGESISRVGQISHARLRLPTHLAPPPPRPNRNQHQNHHHHHHHHNPMRDVEFSSYGTLYEGPQEAFEPPEPIIEIIIKESNESLPAPPPLPTPPPPKKMKEPVQVFYVKYKKDPAGGYGEEKVIYDPPIPAVTPPANNEDSHEEHEEFQQQQQQPDVAYGPTAEEVTAPPPPSTTLKAIIRPDSETFDASGVHITFGGPEETDHGQQQQTADEHDQHYGALEQQSAPQPAVAFPAHTPKPQISRSSISGISTLTKRNPAPYNNQAPQFQNNFPQPSPAPAFPQQPQFPPNNFQHPPLNQQQFSNVQQNFQFNPQPSIQQHQKYTTINNAPPPSQQYHTINQPPSHPQNPPFQPFVQPATPPPLSNPYLQQRAPIRVNTPDPQQQQVEQVNRLQLQQQQLQHELSKHRFQHNQFPQQQQYNQQQVSQQFNQPSPQPTFTQQQSQQIYSQQPTQHQFSQPSQQHNVNNQNQFHNQQQFLSHPHQQQQPLQQKEQKQQISQYKPLPQLQYSTNTDIVKSIDSTNNLYNHREESHSTFTPTPRPQIYTSLRASPTARQYTTTVQASSTTTEAPVEIVTEDPAEVERKKKKKEEKHRKNVENLPDEVPDDLREQLLSSGILSNADIEILDYDKIGDIPLESLPPDALANFQQATAGSRRVQVVRKPDPVQNRDDQDSSSSSSERRSVRVKAAPESEMEMKVVRFNPKEDENVADKYMKHGATQLAPVVLNDNKYNRYLPLQVSGAQFPVPDVPELRGRNVTSVVVLAPVDYEFLNRRDGDSDGRVGRSAAPEPVLEVQGVHFVAGDVLKTLVRMPSMENYRRWLEVENRTSTEKQSVVLLVVEPSPEHPEKEIFMYDIASGRVSKLKGELSSTFVQVAESNSNNQDLEEISDSSAEPGGDFTFRSAHRLDPKTFR